MIYRPAPALLVVCFLCGLRMAGGDRRGLWLETWPVDWRPPFKA